VGISVARGRPVALSPHPDAIEDPESLAALVHQQGFRRPAADLFCGAGGISLGLGRVGFDVVIGVDHDLHALATHRAHHPGLHLDWDLSDEAVLERLADLMRAAGVRLISGGPPCQPFSRAGRGIIGSLVRREMRPPADRRRDLWQSFLWLVDAVRPDAVLMENVPDLALDDDMFIMRTMVHELERIGYGVETAIVESVRYGVPQMRQRFILIAVSDGRHITWPHREAQEREVVTLRDAIEDLGDVEPGWTTEPESGREYASAPTSPYQELMRRRADGRAARRVQDHITRSVRPDDLRAFREMDATTKYSDLPAELKRYRDDIFDDKYKRLDYDQQSRTLTAHLSRDGYAYIHPEHERTITVREAARIQSFPDWFRFSGPPTAAFRQIGNAVPPLLAEGLAGAIHEALELDPEAERRSSAATAERLATWYRGRTDLAFPWLEGPTRWTVAAAQHTLASAAGIARRSYALFVGTSPAGFLAARPERRPEGRLGRDLKDLESIAARLADEEQDPSPDRLRGAGFTASEVGLAAMARPHEDADPIHVTGAMARLAARYWGDDFISSRRFSTGRIAIARLVGSGEDDPDVARAAKLALVELAESVCTTRAPECGRCPLRPDCDFVSGFTHTQTTLEVSL
jgi:DNA (cytosine-5)-methyltransferase 1